MDRMVVGVADGDPLRPGRQPLGLVEVEAGEVEACVTERRRLLAQRHRVPPGVLGVTTSAFPEASGDHSMLWTGESSTRLILCAKVWLILGWTYGARSCYILHDKGGRKKSALTTVCCGQTSRHIHILCAKLRLTLGWTPSGRRESRGISSTMTDAAHIVIVDDDSDTREEIQEYLTRQHYRVSTADGGASMRRILEVEPADLIIVDLTMPEEHGLALVSSIRKTSNSGIIILTGNLDPFDRVAGLELGADDYLCKPCNLRELLARVRSVLRRAKGANDTASVNDMASLEFAGWKLDLGMRTLISHDDTEVPLTTAEFDLLVGFIKNQNRILNRDQLLDITQNREWSPFDRAVDNLVCRLRRKIESDPKKPQLIKTVRGAGYVFTAKVTPI